MNAGWMEASAEYRSKESGRTGGGVYVCEREWHREREKRESARARAREEGGGVERQNAVSGV